MYSIGVKIRKLRKDKNISQEELANKIDISTQALYNYETEKRQIPIDILSKIAKYFEVPIENFFNDSFNEFNSISNKKMKKIPILSNVSAGKGRYAIDEVNDWIELPLSLAKNADFATFVEGDSMEPKIHNFDLVLVKYLEYLENGDIGIFYLNENVYCKKFSANPIEKKYILKSINKTYTPIEVTENDEFRIVGKVVSIIQYNL